MLIGKHLIGEKWAGSAANFASSPAPDPSHDFAIRTPANVDAACFAAGAAMPDRKPVPRVDLKLTQRPIGPVAGFGASNFPRAFSVAGVDTAKGMAAGMFGPVQGGNRDVAEALAQHPLIKTVGFTGFFMKGRPLSNLCAARPKPVSFVGELGSVNPTVLPPAALTGARLIFLWLRTRRSIRRCLCPVAHENPPSALSPQDWAR